MFPASNGVSYATAGLSLTTSTYISAITVTSPTATTITVRDKIVATTASFAVNIGTMRRSKTALPGRVSVVPAAQVVLATPGSSQIRLNLITAGQVVPAARLFLQGKKYNVSSVALCGDYPGSTHYCVTLTTNYTGVAVAAASTSATGVATSLPLVYAFPANVTVYTSVSPVGSLAVGDMVWVGEEEMTVNAVAAQSFSVSGGTVRYGYEGATAFHSGRGYERAIVFKATNPSALKVSLRTVRVTVEDNWRGTNVQVHTHRQDGVPVGTLQLGALSEVQTVFFRAVSPAASIAAATSGATFQLMLGPDTVGNFTYGASAAVWQTKLNTLLNVDSIQVSRTGDGVSASSFYGYAYTVTFWGQYGLEGVPQMTSSVTNLTNPGGLINVYHNTIRDAEYLADASARYIALNGNTAHTLRVKAINRMGISPPSPVVTVNTELYGGLPDRPQAVVLGQYLNESTLSLSFQGPQHDGGLPVTSYLVEADSTMNFDPTTYTYQSTLLSNVPEVQQITTSYRAGDNVKLRGGTFSLLFGGRTSPQLSFDISAYDMELVMNRLVDASYVAVPPVTVTRSAYNRGYRWTVTFFGRPGNMGLIQVDYSMLTGDKPQMSVVELVQGKADIMPGGYTYEVQTVRVGSLAPLPTAVVGGQTRPTDTFVLNMEGYDTPAIRVDETARAFMQKLASLPTIYTVKVTRELLSAPNYLYAWTITFAHMRHEVVQGAGDLPPFTVTSATFSPTLLASVNVFELIKGTHPLQYALTGLVPGVKYNARVTAYNSRGYSLTSSVASATVLGQPPRLGLVMANVASGTALNVTWAFAPPSGSSSGSTSVNGQVGPATSLPVSALGTLPTSNAVATNINYQVDGYLVEYYTSNPVYEVQVITTSSGPSLSAIQRITVDSDANNLAGYFKVEFQGATTANIRYDANPEGEDSLAQALVRLPTMGAVAVTRADSRRAVPSLLVNGTAGATFVTVTHGGAAAVKPLNTGDVIWIGTTAVPLTITAITTTAATGVIQISFAPSTLSFVASFTAAQVFKWSYGYTWDVTFLTQIGPQPSFVVTTSDNWAGTNPVLKVT